ncbi:MAG TPA: ribosome small subunit-dependent GTPase A [Symbiobacteriaceae bacterium]|nr:ribosome small subunit-dependent GTPase A [Symbiobacteriaceae bacterium]
MAVGQVIRAHSNIYYVLSDGQEVECRPRGRFRLDKTGVLAGDLVEIHLEPNGEGRIDKILPRKTELQRPPIANVDQALVVFTIKEPEADYLFLDRVLVHVARVGVDAVLILNKADLLSPEAIAAFHRLYGEQVGYPVVTMAAKHGIGVEEIKPHLKGRVSVLAGHSGVGKSRLVRALDPTREDVKVGELSAKLGRGKHTTRHVELMYLPDSGGLIADAPGFTYLEFENIEKKDVPGCFPEFERLRHECRFDDCMHNKEPDCAVHEAVAEGRIAASRYQNYLLFLKEVEALKRW